jgi:hypothetical protein
LTKEIPKVPLLEMKYFNDPEHLNYDGSRQFGAYFAEKYLNYKADENWTEIDVKPLIEKENEQN